MKHHRRFIVDWAAAATVALLPVLSAPATAQVDEFTTEFHPTFAGTKVTISAGGTWPHVPWPGMGGESVTVAGNQIDITLIEGCGLNFPTGVQWMESVTTPPLPHGEYDVNIVIVNGDVDLGCDGAVLWTGSETVTVEPPVAEFHGLGDLPGGDFDSEALAVNADGTVVAGRASVPIYHGLGSRTVAFRWTAGTEMTELADPGGFSYANGLSDDGSIAAGFWQSFSALDNTVNVVQWSDDGRMETLAEGPLALGHDVEPGGISGDGGTIVGSTTNQSQSPGQFIGFRWTGSGGVELLGTLPGGSASHATDISADGSVIVGSGDTPQGNRPFRWTKADGMESLGQIDDGGGAATAVSADGSIIVGWAITGLFSSHPFRWTEASGYEFIVPGFMLPEDVSGDGAIMVGGDDLSSEPTEARMWHEGFTDGPRSVNMVLQEDYGLDLTGWTLQSATAISTDGSTIVGYGTNPEGNTEAWRVALTAPTLGDINGDGSVSTADLLQLLSAWGACAACPEDLDNDNIVGTSDLLMLIGNWG